MWQGKGRIDFATTVVLQNCCPRLITNQRGGRRVDPRALRAQKTSLGTDRTGALLRRLFLECLEKSTVHTNSHPGLRRLSRTQGLGVWKWVGLLDNNHDDEIGLWTGGELGLGRLGGYGS